MNRQSLTVLLIEDSPDYADLVEDWLSEKKDGTAFVLNWTDSLQAGLERLAKGGIDVILLDLGLPDSNGTETFRKLKAGAPSIPVIVLSSADSQSVALEMIREGAEDYLVKNTCNAEALARAVRYAFLRHQSHTAKPSIGSKPNGSRVAGFIGAKGGVGATTTACTLATELREQTGEKVLLADFDMHRGLVSFLSGIEPRYSLLDAVENLNRLDITCWQSIVSSGPGDIDVVPSPGLLGDGNLDADSLVRVLDVVLPFYGWAVLDLGPVNALSMRLLEKVNDIFIVTTTAITTLYQTKRVIEALLKANVEQDRIRLVVNQMENGDRFSGNDLNSIFGIPVYGILPASREDIHKASIQRKLPPEGSNFRKEVARIARKVAGISEKQSKRGFAPFRPRTAKLQASIAK